MSTTAPPTTAKQLAKLPDDGKRYELVNGELRMMSPAGNVHGRVAMRVAAKLWNHVQSNHLGEVFAAETGFLLSRNPDTVRAPDAAFVRQEALDQVGDVTGFLPLAPDLVVEVVSPSDSYSGVEEKALAWLTAGSSMVVVVDPGTQTVQIFRNKNDVCVLNDQDELDAGDVVTGWKLKIGELFA